MADQPTWCPCCEAEPSEHRQAVIHAECEHLFVSDPDELWEDLRDCQYHGSVDKKGRLTGGRVSIRETFFWIGDGDEWKAYRTGNSPGGGWQYYLSATRNWKRFGGSSCSKRYDSREESIAAAHRAMEKQEKRYRKMYPPRR